MMNKSIIKDLQIQGLLSAIDVYFARFISEYAIDGGDADLFLAAALVSRATGQGDICLDLTTVAGNELSDRQDNRSAVVCPPLEDWLSTLKASPAVGKPGDIRPLILDARHRLYLYRYWEYEQAIVHSIKSRIERPIPTLDFEHLKRILDRLFPKTQLSQVDWQKIAATVACLKHFCVITGGPGTGKTFTVTKVLALLLELLADQRLQIYLAAPTGKAAARLQQALEQARDNINFDKRVEHTFPAEVFTIHRMLKPIKGSPYFRYNSENPLIADVVVVDEASMVDLALMAKLLDAVPQKARLIFIGDKDQLASVEAGSVLGDICDRDVIHGFSGSFKRLIGEITGENIDAIVPTADGDIGLQDSIVVLHKSYRFAPESGIGALSRVVNRGDADAALDILADTAEKSIAWQPLKSDTRIMEALSEQIVIAYQPYLEARDPAEALHLLERFKILCALNIGPLGVQAVNRLAQQVLSRHNLIRPDTVAENPWYAGRPVLITRNHYPLGLFNGDIGITLAPAGAKGRELVVYFRASDGGVRRFLPQQLPEHETVYAMTVHKSQGSEFDNVLLILPNQNVSILTRELMYTALTRARQKITIWGTPEILRGALTRKIQRTSGLRDALWNFRKQQSEDG
ncbi:MAG: exodeoxyribonuclease V subunit alpha [Desulfobacterales bacterium]